MDGPQVGLVHVCKPTALTPKQALTLTPGGQSDPLGWRPAILAFTLIPEPCSILYPVPGVSVTRSQESAVVRDQRCPVDGTVGLLFPAPRAPEPGSRRRPPAPGTLMDALACKTTYETLNNNNVVISHSPSPRASI